MTEKQRPAVVGRNGEAGMDVLSRTTAHTTAALIYKLDRRGLRQLSVCLRLSSGQVLSFTGREAQTVLLLSTAGTGGISRKEFAIVTGGLDLPAHISAIRRRGVEVNHRYTNSQGFRTRCYWLSEDADIWLEEPAQTEFWSLLEPLPEEG